MIDAIRACEPTFYAAEASQTAARLRSWLLDGPAQIHDGPHRGGIAGCIREGVADYVYPEITGYFLHWLSGLNGALPRALLEDRAARVVEWAARYICNDRVPSTRIHLREGMDDWRNDGVFFFDLAMLLRGLCAVHEATLAAVPRPLTTRIVERLAQFISGERFRAALPLRTNRALPQRWSTTGGPFLVKAASHVLYCASSFDVPSDLLKSCANEIARWVSSIDTMSPGMLHPTLYFAEGAIVVTPERASSIAGLVRRCLWLMKSDGSLPESDDGNGDEAERVDIVAQVLRLGILLRRNGFDTASDDASMQRLAERLVRSVRRDGSIPFVRERPNEANVWCAMFAEQALRWYSEYTSFRTCPPNAFCLV